MAAIAAVALVTAIPAGSQAKDTTQATTRYDGEATAFQTSGLTLTLFPADEDLPAAFDAIERPPEQVVELSSEQLGLPSQVGHAEYRGVDKAASLPANPLLRGSALRAASTKVGGKVVSKALIGRLDIGGGVLTLEDVVARCTGDGQQVSVEAPLGTATGQIEGEVELKPGTETTIPGIGRITWNTQTTDGATYGEVSNLVIDLQTNLDADVLEELPEAMAAFEDVVQQVLADLQDAGQQATGVYVPGNPQSSTGQPLYDALESVLSQIPTDQLSDLNPLIELSGSITLASAACSQEANFEPPENPPPDNDGNPPPGEEPPGEGGDEPPLADTGVSPWPARAGVVGLLAIATGGLLVLRQRRHPG